MSEKLSLRNPSRLVSMLSRAVRLIIGRGMEKYDVGTGQYPFLFTLLHEDGISQDELSQRVFADKGTTARALRSLERTGYVRREPVEGNRRMNNVCITQKTRAIRKDIRMLLWDTEQGLTQGFSLEEREMLLVFLERMEINARRMAKERT